MQMTDVTGRGGAEKALVDLALGLDRNRYQVTVCATRTAGNYQPLLDAAGVRSIILERHSRRDLGKLAGLVRRLRRERVHVLHTHLFGSNTWGRLLGRLAGVPIIIAHEHWSSKAQKEIWVDRLLYRLSDRILVPSQASKRIVMALEGIPARYIDVIYNGVDISRFCPDADRGAVRQELNLPEDAVVVGTVGRLSADKGGQDHLIRAVAGVRRAHPGVRLLIVGDGPLRPGLEALAATELGEAARFTGQRADVARLLGALDVFVLPSLREALPIAVLEAMAMRLPAVATRVGGVPEVVEDGMTGFVVPPGDEVALRAALARLVDDPGLRDRLGAAGQARVHAHFTLQQMVRQVEHLYDALARRKLRARSTA
jgi:glycosyltransferase involved in cell wall biosynthesis